jgi:transcriptional regulator GlxA family with amidase domain
VFAVADAVLGGDAYRVRIVSPDGRDVVSSSGFRVGVVSSAAEVDGPVDTLIVPGTWTWPEAIGRPALLAAVSAGAARSRRVVSVCVGAFVLAEAGLLNGRRATTHWRFFDELAERYPAVALDRDAIFVADGAVYTSAGVSSGIDLALALVEADHGAAVARLVAQHLVVFMQRPGGQAQFSVRLRAQPVSHAPLRAVLDAVAEDPAGDHRLEALSARAGFSSRHLSRVFVREVGMTPARYVEQVRVEAARALLASSDAPLEVVARSSGLGSVESLRRAFRREVGVTPHAYRRRFETTGIAVRAG